MKQLMKFGIMLLTMIFALGSCYKEDIDNSYEDVIHKFYPDAENVTIQYLGETISCQNINGMLIFQGDIIVVPNEIGTRAASYILSGDYEPDFVGPRLPGIQLWTEGKIYYFIDENKFGFRSDVLAAMERISSHTNIKFIELKTPVAQNYRERSYINFITENEKSWSYIGMLSSWEMQMNGMNAQNLSIGWSEVGTVIHELGHALGLMHEHARVDRDEYVKINKRCIDGSEEEKNNNWLKKFDMGKNSEFDYRSIMIYHPNAGRNKWAILADMEVIEKKEGDSYTSYIDEYQHSHLSEKDIETINKMYPKLQAVSPDFIISEEASDFLSNNIYRTVGEVIYTGEPTITERGIYYGKENTITTKVSAAGSVLHGTFACDLIGLEPNTTYTAKAYVIQNGTMIVSANLITFKTPDGLTQDIHNIIPDDIFEKIQELGTEINGGNNPPNIEGAYLVSPLTLVSTNVIFDATPGTVYWKNNGIMDLAFSEQNNTNLTVKVDHSIGDDEVANGYNAPQNLDHTFK